MSDDVDKYIGKNELDKMPIEKVNICRKIISTYQGVGEDNTMLLSAITVYKRLYPKIRGLPTRQQLDIVHEVTMIAYDARTKAFEHMINYNPKEETR
jgi:hypothetical protein